VLAGCVSSRLTLGEPNAARAQLLDASGHPLSATPIQIVLDRRPGRTALEAERIVLSGRTDVTGRFVFGYPASKVRESSLWADLGDGWQLVDVLTHHAWSEAGDGDPEELPLEVRERKNAFRIHVRDEANHPIARATIRLVAGEYAAPVGHLPARSTNKSGVLVWRGFPWGSWWADISSPGYAPVRTCPYQFSGLGPSGLHYEVRLLAGRDVLVEVLDENGGHVADAEVEYAYPNLNLPTYSRWIVKTDARGMVSITLPLSVETEIIATSLGREASVSAVGDTGRLTIRLFARSKGTGGSRAKGTSSDS